MSLPPADWPLADASRAVAAGGLDWHVQLRGRGPMLLLLHGSGGSAHSWAGLVPRLAAHATVVAPDLPGHGFTRGAALAELTLPRMAERIVELLDALALPPPALVVGHSAGAALALRLALDMPEPPALLGFNPSLVAPPAVYSAFIAPLLHPVATAWPTTAMLASVAAPFGLVDRLLDSTGSTLTPTQREPYRRLFAQHEHLRGALGFMAAADLPALLRRARQRGPEITFVLGARDHWIPEAALRVVLERNFPQAQVERWDGGHLVHEEQPERAARRVLAALPSAMAAVER